MGATASQITSLTIFYSTVYSGADQKNIKFSRHWPLCGEFTGDRWRHHINQSQIAPYYIKPTLQTKHSLIRVFRSSSNIFSYPYHQYRYIGGISDVKDCFIESKILRFYNICTQIDVVIWPSFRWFVWCIIPYCHGCSTCAGELLWLPRYQWSNPENYGYIWPVSNHNKTQQRAPLVFFLGICCIWVSNILIMFTLWRLGSDKRPASVAG